MSVTNFPNGISTSGSGAFRDFPHPNPTKIYGLHHDFLNLNASDWVITNVGSGTYVIADEKGGVLTVTNGASDNDHVFFQHEGVDDASQTASETFKFETGKKIAFTCKFRTNAPTQSDIYFGLYDTDATPVAGIAEGVYFRKADESTAVNLVVVTGGVETVTQAFSTVVTSEFVELEFYYDGKNEIKIYANGTHVATSGITTLPTTELALSFGIQNGVASAGILGVDWISCLAER